METRPLGGTGIVVSALGLGAGRIGGAELSDAEVDRFLGAALDEGVTLFDTARSYGLSEERIGRALSGRRESLVLSTKVGYGVEGAPDWTGPCVTRGIEDALRRLRTDRIDVVHLHSCPREVLAQGEVVEALTAAVRAGKVRAPAYSGEGEALLWAIRCGAFAVVQCSVSIVDQAPLEEAVPLAASRRIGVLAKRPLGNAPWRFDRPPPEPDVAEAFRRFRALAPEPAGIHWPERFARFAAFAPSVSAILLGTSRIDHLRAAAAALRAGSLDPGDLASLRAAYARQGGWPGRI